MTEIPRLKSALLETVAGIDHGFFTRRGGVSRGVYDSLNMGLGSRDDPDSVRENRRRAAAAFGMDETRLITAYQVHSAQAVISEEPWSGSPPEADAVVTGATGLILGALSADCAPILIADGAARLVAAVHAGWRGALEGVIGAAVEGLVSRGAARERLVATVGPCIAGASYEVGLEFEARFLAASANFAAFFTAGVTPDKRHFDLPAFALARLREAGVSQADWIGADTCAEEANFFSNRRAVKRGEPDYGRLMSAIMIRP
jgi:YfiH family protein